MLEKDYLLLLKKHAKSKRVICGFKEEDYGRAIVTTGVPKQYKEGQITYEDEKKVSYENYITGQIKENAKVRRKIGN